jgi:hypothetical protein
MFIDFIPTLKEKAYNYLKTFMILSLFTLSILFLGAYGVIGFILTVIGIAAYKIYLSRDLFFNTIQSVSKKIMNKEDEEENDKSK